MVTIRLSRFGRKKAPFYRIAVTDSSKKAVGGVIEYVGTWNPAKKTKNINIEKISEWLGKGAKVSNAVSKILEEKEIKKI